MLDGNLGRAVSKVSAVKAEHLVIEAPAKVFDDQLELLRAFEAGELDGQDFVAVIRYQGPSANGMPELHKLTPPLAVLLDRGQRVAIVTDGRMSGASGKVPAAIHLSPEAAATAARSRWSGTATRSASTPPPGPWSCWSRPRSWPPARRRARRSPTPSGWAPAASCSPPSAARRAPPSAARASSP